MLQHGLDNRYKEAAAHRSKGFLCLSLYLELGAAEDLTAYVLQVVYCAQFQVHLGECGGCPEETKCRA